MTARLFVRVAPSKNGTWQVRRGREVIDVFDSFEAALQRAQEVAAALAPSTIFLHRGDKTIVRFADYD